MNPKSIYYLFEAGHKRKQEDYIWPIPGKATVHDKVFIVCDGAGSFNNGEIASKLICQFMAAKVLKFGEHKMSEELINRLLIEARDRLITYAKEYRLDTDLGTTFSMLTLYDQKVLLSWYGDSRIYHLREGEILFRTEDNSLVDEPLQLSEISRENNRLQSWNFAIAHGIKADSSPIYAETKWIEDVQDGDYFLLCTKALTENVTDDEIKFLLSQNDKTNIDLTESFKQLAFEKTSENYSMYLIGINLDTQKRAMRNGIIVNKKKTSGMTTPFFILSMTIIGLLIIFFYFRNARTFNPAPQYTNQTTQLVDVPRNDSVPSAITRSEPPKPIPTVTDSAKNNSENSQATPQNDNSADSQTGEKTEQANQTIIRQQKLAAQLLIKLTTNESCKLKITNINLEEVIDWDLSQNDNGTIYLKPGKYLIVATSVIDSSETKTYNFDVKPGDANTTQNLHIRF
jgi:serine/threonine protein phosphatase PrpC